MRAAQVVEALSSLGAVRVTASGDQVHGFVPAIGDRFQLLARDVHRVAQIVGPRREPAIELAVRGGDAVRTLIVTGRDVVFPPAEAASQLDSPVTQVVRNAPGLVAYSEMLRDARRLALVCEREPSPDFAGLAGSFLLLRCCIMGAVVFGLRPATAVAWWRRGWDQVGGDLPLAPFRADVAWDDLSRDAARVTLPLVHLATVEEFEALAPTMIPLRLDPGFLVSWNIWVGLPPSTVAESLTSGLRGPSFTFHLYPDGAGGVDLRVRDGGVLAALLQLRFSFPAGVLYLDEIRVEGAARGTGIFQQLLSNTERLGETLRLDRIEFLATGIGAYALARFGDWA